MITHVVLAMENVPKKNVSSHLRTSAWNNANHFLSAECSAIIVSRACMTWVARTYQALQPEVFVGLRYTKEEKPQQKITTQI